MEKLHIKENLLTTKEDFAIHQKLLSHGEHRLFSFSYSIARTKKCYGVRNTLVLFILMNGDLKMDDGYKTILAG
jgi:hypothetical protein